MFRSFRVFFLAILFLLNINISPVTAKTILPSIASDIGVSATQNIEKAERLFCYVVSAKPQNYSGYTLDNMAVTGFCGIIDDNLKDLLIEQILTTQNNIDFINVENCTIQPRILLRFVRGVDNTDVLLSAPCYSASVFYGGNIKTYNMKPAANLLDTIANAFQTSQTNFVSPALLNQLLPIGVPPKGVVKPISTQSSEVKKNWSTPQETSRNNAWNSLKFSQ